jgi:acetyl esterase/lipase
MTADRDRRTIAAMGSRLGPDVLQAVQALYRDEQLELAAAAPPLAVDLPYGSGQRQRLDLYAGPAGAVPARPILLWVHGGGFLRGDKGGPGQPFNAHAGRWAARHGLVGAVLNYRLAPDHQWPAGGEDVLAAVDRLRADAASWGGDPDRLILAGTSAGAVHVATALRLRPDLPGVRALVLLSGLYGFTDLDERDTLYYGAPELYPERWPRDAVVDTVLPLLVATAEHDPTRFQREAAGLLAARLERHGRLPRFFYGSGHNHFSLAYHLGTGDTRLADEMIAFIGEHA